MDRSYFNDELLRPISAEQPCGRDLRHQPLFREILEACRSDEPLNAGEWEKVEGPKTADWPRTADLCLDALSNETKDLRLFPPLTEAAIRLNGFGGLRDCLRLTKEYLYRFWDQGLLPAVQDGDLDERADPLFWINDRMPHVMCQVPLTARAGRDENYSYLRFLQAQKTVMAGSSDQRRETVEGFIKQGYITMEAFEGAMKATSLQGLDAIYAPFEEALEQFEALARLVDKKFDTSAPPFTGAREAFEEIQRLLQLWRKRKAPAANKAATPAGDGTEVISPLTAIRSVSVREEIGSVAPDSWAEAEALVRTGKVDAGLSRMAALVAEETSGRGQYLRKLALVDVCLGADRTRLARTILEELNLQITEYKLDRWESSALVGAVWFRLYKIYQKSDVDAELELAGKLYNQLCHLDPWQAYLNCRD